MKEGGVDRLNADEILPWKCIKKSKMFKQKHLETYPDIYF